MILRRAAAFLAALALLWAAPAWAAGTVVVTTSDVGHGVTKYSIDWTSDAAGAVSGNAFAVTAGTIFQVEYTPDAAGTQPTDLYDATLVYANGLDLLQGSGANLSNVTAYGPVMQALYFHDGTRTVDLVIANAGNAKGGTVVIWVGP